jgi:hypothetical protein
MTPWHVAALRQVFGQDGILDWSRRGDRRLHFHMVSKFRVQSYTLLVSSVRQEVSALQSFGSCDDFLWVRFRHCYLGLTKHTRTTQPRKPNNGDFIVVLLLLPSFVLEADLCRRPMHACKERILPIWNAAYLRKDA